jgi:CheY-like chemotaxis protein
VALQGNLEDLPLLDIIQIVSFSKKTGYLSIEVEGGDGAIVFREGLVVAAFTADSPPADRRLASLPPEARDKAVRGRIGFALEHLARLREGGFGFELTDDVPGAVGGRDIRLETLARGINPQEMLLDLAQGLDDGRTQSAEAVEASFAAPIAPGEALPSDIEALAGEPPDAPAADAEVPLTSRREWETLAVERPGTDTRPLPKVMLPGPRAGPLADSRPAGEGRLPAERKPPAGGRPARTVLLVDDEEDVRRILGRQFLAAGFRVVEAGDPEEAAKVAAKTVAEGPFVLVTDLGMPASGGASFHGGFEVVKRLWKMNLRPPVLMMTESLNQSLRLRARQMGVQSFVFKPTLSKLNAPQFEADLSAFAAKLAAGALPRLAEAAGAPPAPRTRKSPAGAAAPAAGAPAEDAARPFEFLRRHLVELRQGADANAITALVMKVAREFFERAVLFVVKNDEARGLGGFGLAPHDETLSLLARQIAIPLGEASVFRDVAQGRRAFGGAPPRDRWLAHLMGRIGRFQSQDVVLLPLVTHRETIALLFGDNPETGRAPEGLEALEVFVQQAGIALENVFLQRKLQTIEEKDRPPLR